MWVEGRLSPPEPGDLPQVIRRYRVVRRRRRVDQPATLYCTGSSRGPGIPPGHQGGGEGDVFPADGTFIFFQLSVALEGGYR